MRSKIYSSTLFVFACLTTAAQAQDVKFFSAVAVRAAVTELMPQFEAQTGKKVALKFELNPTVKKQIDEGETFDVVLINPPMIEDLVKSGKVTAGSSVKFGRIPMGLAIKAGAPKPDIASVESFKRTLLSAKTVGYVGEGSSGIYFDGLLAKLGIADEMKGKLRTFKVGTEVGAAIARGEIEFGASPVMNLFASGPGVEVAGVFPAELQSYIEFAVARSTSAKDAATSMALIEFLTSSKTDAFFKTKGLERMK